jgi:hypothetical protein
LDPDQQQLEEKSIIFFVSKVLNSILKLFILKSIDIATTVVDIPVAKTSSPVLKYWIWVKVDGPKLVLSSFYKDFLGQIL